MHKRIISGLLSVLVSTSVFSSTMSTKIDLGGAPVYPASEAQISLAGLLPNVQYTINCSIEVSDCTMQSAVVAKFELDNGGASTSTEFYLNGEFIGNNVAQKTLQGTSHKLVVEHVTVGSGNNQLKFSNADFDFGYMVYGCQATS